VKIVILALICYDILYKKEILANLENPNYFDEEILAEHPDPIQKYCKMLHENHVEVEFWYLSDFSKGVQDFTHKYGHTLKRISAFNLNKFFGKYLDYPWSFTLLRELRKNNVTHVLLRGYLMSCRVLIDMADRVIDTCRKNSIKILPVYGGGSIRNYKKLKKRIKLSFLNKVNGYICQSRSEIDLMVNKLNFPIEKINYFKNPLDLENFYPIKKSVCAQKLNKDINKRYILYIGRFVQTKGIHHLINIWNRLIETEPSLNLILVGWGPYHEELKKRIEKSGLYSSITIIKFVQNDQLKYYYNLAGIFVLPSYAEGTPNVLMEAIACNTICVASNVGGIPDLLGAGVGVIVPPKDEEALYKAILCVLNGGFMINQEKRRDLLKEIDMNRKGRELIRILQQVK
jgi:glycosyltransferase involved in cell wall biosynthesis